MATRRLLESEYKGSQHDETVAIRSLHVDGYEYNIDPALRFLCEFDREAHLFQIHGVGICEDISAYGETLDEAGDMMEGDIIPSLWAEYTQEDDSKLSPKAQIINADLGGGIGA